MYGNYGCQRQWWWSGLSTFEAPAAHMVLFLYIHHRNEQQDALQEVKKKRSGLLSASKTSYLQICLNKYVVPAMMHPIGKTIVLALLVGGVATGIVGATRLGEGLRLSSLANDNHYAKPFEEMNTEFERQAGVLCLPRVLLEVPSGECSVYFHRLIA
jgi:hypothetical protein